MPLEGEYAPSPWDWVREQVEEYEASNGERANTLLDTGLPVWLSFRRCRHGVCGVYGEHWGGPEGDAFGRAARRFEEMGGIQHIFLTHRDDVADAARYAARFGAQRIIHRLELHSQPDAERVLEGFQPIELAPGFVAIPTPGHTRCHCALLAEERFLFTGDHIWWSRNRGRLNSSRDVCWFSWGEQVASVRRLENYSFEWVLPGHGERAYFPRPEMAQEMARLVAALAA